MDDTEPAELGWHVIHGQDLITLLFRAFEGEDPNLLMLSLFANSDTMKVPDDES